MNRNRNGNGNRWTGFAAAALTAALCAAPAVAGMDTPDPWITVKSKTQLYAALGAAASAINVDTHEARVTMHGKVANEGLKAEAETVVSAIHGVDRVKNLLQVVPQERRKAADVRDELIAERLAEAFEADPILRAADVEVRSVHDGMVLLGGEVETMSANLRAFEIAYGVKGVTGVSSEVKSPDALTEWEIWTEDSAAAIREADGEKQRSAGAAAHDAWLTGKVKARLVADDEVSALDVNVDTRKGVVTLFGIVPDAEAKRAAQKVAEKTEGVDEVRNELIVETARSAAAR